MEVMSRRLRVADDLVVGDELVVGRAVPVADFSGAELGTIHEALLGLAGGLGGRRREGVLLLASRVSSMRRSAHD